MERFLFLIQPVRQPHLCWFPSAPRLLLKRTVVVWICLGTFGLQLRPCQVDPMAPPPDSKPITPCLGSSLPRLHQIPSSLRLHQALSSLRLRMFRCHFVCPTDLRAFSYSSSPLRLHGLCLPTGSTLVLSPTGSTLAPFLFCLP
ncbi:hypothetical protein PO909_008908 [Leuciscus waleckii]